jgi:nucleoside 2-deoxyribosyltransferase
MIYLASPYSHVDPAVREQRFTIATRVAAKLIRAGHQVFSPISHSHPIASNGVPTDWTFWKAFDRRMLEACDELIVLMLDGWRESRGVQAEINLAIKLGKPIRYVSPEHAASSPTLGQVA